MKIYAIKDDLNAFGLPFFQHNDLVAKRAFAVSARDPASMVAAAPGDYSLYCLGDFDERTGSIVSHDPAFICRATDLLSKEVQKE